MTKTAYTEEEFRKMIQELFTEKKQVKELQRQLHGLEGNTRELSDAELLAKSIGAGTDYSVHERELMHHHCEQHGADAYACEELIRLHTEEHELALKLAASEEARRALQEELDTTRSRHQQLSDIVTVLKQKFESGALSSATAEAKIVTVRAQVEALQEELHRVCQEKAALEEDYHRLASSQPILADRLDVSASDGDGVSFWQGRWSDLQGAYDAKQEELARAELALADAEHEMNILKEQQKNAKAPCTDGLERRLYFLEQELAKRDEEISALRVSQDALAAKSDELSQQLLESTNVVARLENELESANGSLSDAYRQLECGGRLHADASDSAVLAQEHASLKLKYQQLEQQQQWSKEGSGQLEDLMETLQGELFAAKNELSTAQRELEVARSASHALALENEELREQKDADEASIASFNVDLSMTRESLAVTQHRLEAEQTIAAHLRAEVQGATERFSVVQHQKTELEEAVITLKAELKNAEDRVSGQRHAVESLEDERCMLQLQVASLEEQLQAQEKAVTAITQELGVVKVEAAATLAEAQSTRNALAIKLQECVNLERQYATLKEENSALLSQARNLEPLEGVQQALAAAKMEIAHLQGALEQAQLESDQHAGEAAEHEQRAKEQKEQLESLSARVSQLQEALAEQERELSQSQQAERALKTQVGRFANENAAMQQTLQDTQDLLRQNRAASEKQRGEWQVEAEVLKGSQRKLEERIKTLSQELDHHRMQTVQLEQKALELGKYQHLSEAARERLQETRQQLQQLQAQNARYKQQVAQAEEEIEQREQEIRSLRYKEEQARQGQESALNAAGAFRQQMNDLESALGSAQEEIAAAKEDAEAKRQLIDHLKESLQKAQEKHQTDQQEAIALLSTLELSREQTSAAMRQLAEKESGLASLQEELEEIRKALIRGVHEANAIKERYAAVVQERAQAMQQHRLAQQMAKERGELLERSRQQHEELLKRLQEGQQALEKAAGEIAALRASKAEMQERIDTIDSESIQIRHALAAAEKRREAEELSHREALAQMEEKFHQWAGEKDSEVAATKDQHIRLQHAAEKQYALLREEKERALAQAKEHLEHTITTLEQERRTVVAAMEGKVAELGAAHKRISEMESEKALLSKQYKEVSQQVQEIRQQSQEVNRVLEERDNRLRLAQQHLAKKMKEATILQEKMDQQRVEFLELNNELNAQKARVSELEGNLRLQQQHDEKLQTMVQERVRTAEVQALQWQEKYFALQDSWQSTKGRLAELEKLQAEYEQVQSLFSNLKTMIGTPIGSAAPVGAKSHSPLIEARLVSSQKDEERQESSRTTQRLTSGVAETTTAGEGDTLFSSTGGQPSGKVRATLFEG